MDELIPADVRDFILRHIDSVAQLEALLLLRGSPDEAWDIGTIAKRLYTGDNETAEILSQLRRDGLVSVVGGAYRYERGSPEQQSIVDNLAALYSRHLIPISNMIHRKPRRIRQFADAFKFRKEP